MYDVPKNEYLVLFDGVCNLCESSVLFIIKHDKKNKFKFSPLESDISRFIISTHQIDTKKTDSILLYTPDKKLYAKSTAALKIAAQLGFPINLLSLFLILPKLIRDYVYSFMAKHRYRWFGKKEACLVPTSDLKSKFIY
ncbi:thiol-disulfide oxidoreductase DCC family protein [Formosa sp. S-31]|uniref:thiol-disulfide oxidoreductase DCC family protein n=1 Tax=Formosa sp. S-31 TaxID=2790949 RepID=UPI003EBBF9DE